MYAAVRYFNHGKDISFTILKTFNSFKNANKYALECAQKDFGIKNVVKGYDEIVYNVIEIPEPEDEICMESDTDTEIESEEDDDGSVCLWQNIKYKIKNIKNIKI